MDDISSRLKTMSLEEIENFIRSEVIKNLSFIFQNLLIAGRINGNGQDMIKRIEDETIRVVREHWVK